MLSIPLNADALGYLNSRRGAEVAVGGAVTSISGSASGAAGPTNLDQAISNFIAPTTGTYIAVSGFLADTYNLVVMRDAAFDSEPNDSFATAQDLLGNAGVLGGDRGTIACPVGCCPKRDGRHSGGRWH